MSGSQREALIRIVEGKDELAGRFSEIRRIDPSAGGGYFSLVFEALDTVTGENVALKFFDPLKRSDRYRLAAFGREAAVLEEMRGQRDVLQLAAPMDRFVESLATEAGITVDVEFEYFAVELAGSNALEAIAVDLWSPIEILTAFRAMVRSVQRIHGLDYSHRDIKPANFLVMSSGGVRLSDFGTARSVARGSQPLLPQYGFWPGDYGYAAPEVLAGLHDENPSIAKAADVYALGCVLFELFAGVRLSSQLFTTDFINELVVSMGQVASEDRRRIFHEIVAAIADAHPIPTVDYSGGRAPNCVKRQIDELVGSLAALDYRHRPRWFEPIFRKINICTVILENETKYLRWRSERRKRRLAIVS